MVRPAVTACLVTRGDVDLGPILSSLPSEWPVVVWDNSQREDLGVYGRYAAVAEARTAVVYVQDDDCLIDADRVAAAYEPGRLVANMPRSRWPDYPDSTLVGWGAVFDRHLPRKAFVTMDGTLGLLNAEPRSPVFLRTSDVIFSALTPRTVIDIGFQHLPWAETPGRMFRQPGHKAERDMVLEQCRRIRDHDDDVRSAA